MPCCSYLDGCDEVLLPVRSQLTDRQLRASQNDRFTQILQHEAERRGSICHRVRAMQDDKAVEAVVILSYDAHKPSPMLQTHIAGIDGRVEGEGMNAEVEAAKLGHFVEDKVEVKALQGSRFGILPHADGATRVDEQHAGATIVHTCVHGCTKIRKNIELRQREIEKIGKKSHKSNYSSFLSHKF